MTQVIFPFGDLPVEIKLNCLSFLPKKDLYQIRSVSTEWRDLGNAALRRLYLDDIDLMKNHLIESLSYVEHTIFYETPFNLVDALKIFHFPFKEMSLDQLSKEAGYLKKLIPHLIVHAKVTISDDNSKHILTHFDIYKIREEIAKLGMRQDDLNEEELFIQPAFINTKRFIKDSFDLSAFWDQAPFSLCKQLPCFFPRKWFEGLNEGEHIAFLLRGKIVVMQVHFAAQDAHQIAHPPDLENIYVREKDAHDFMEDNGSRVENQQIATLKFISLSDEKTYQRYRSQDLDKNIQQEVSHLQSGNLQPVINQISNFSKASLKKILILNNEQEVCFLNKLDEEIKNNKAFEPLISKIRKILNKRQLDSDFYECCAKIYIASIEFFDSYKVSLKMQLHPYMVSAFQHRIFELKVKSIRYEALTEFFRCAIFSDIESQFTVNKSIPHYFQFFDIGDIYRSICIEKGKTLSHPEVAALFSFADRTTDLTTFHNKKIFEQLVGETIATFVSSPPA